VKRVISVFLVALFLFSFASPVLAADPQTPISREEALKLAQAAVEIPDGMKLNNVSYRYDEFGGQVWGFNWNLNSPKSPRDISVEIDAVSGRLRSLYQYSPDNYGESKYTVEEAQAIAEEFLKKTIPNEYGQLKLEPQVNQIFAPSKKPQRLPEYYFRFNRVVNGYPYWDNGANVAVSSSNGKIFSFNFNWDAGELPSVDNVVYRKDAQKIFLDKVGIGLNYLRVYKEGGPAEVALGYSTPLPYVQVYIDGVTGELIDISGNKVDLKANSNGPIGADTGPVPADKVLTMEEAMELAEQWVDLQEGHKLNGVNYYENQDGVTPAVWNFSWLNKAGAGYNYMNVGINARTGEVVNIDSSYEPYNQSTGITEEEAKTIAAEFLQKVAPSKAGQLRLDVNNNFGEYPPVGKDGLRPVYYFHFSRLINGVPFVDNGASVNVNGQGKVMSYYSNWEEFKFPSIDDVISTTEAADLAMGQMGFDLGYVRIRDAAQDWKIRLAYRVNTAEFYIDAKTGEIKNRWEGKILYSRAGFGDVAGHWAEKDIQRLSDLKIVDAEAKNFEPDVSASRGVVVTMLAKALKLNSYLPDKPTFNDVPADHKFAGYIEAAYKAGIVTGYDGKFNPETAISRQEFAVILDKGLGDTEAISEAKLEDFKDADKISDWAAQSMLQAVKLGLLKGDNNGNLSPEKDVTKAEAAALIARILDSTKG